MPQYKPPGIWLANTSALTGLEVDAIDEHSSSYLITMTLTTTW